MAFQVSEGAQGRLSHPAGLDESDVSEWHMSELALTLLRFGFLALLWCFVLITVGALRRDLRAPTRRRCHRADANWAQTHRSGRIRPRNLVVAKVALREQFCRSGVLRSRSDGRRITPSLSMTTTPRATMRGFTKLKAVGLSRMSAARTAPGSNEIGLPVNAVGTWGTAAGRPNNL